MGKKAKEIEEGKADAGAFYTKGWWKGIRQWRCKVCGWDTLVSEEEMVEHVTAMHLPKVTRRVVESPILDRFGNPIRREVVEVRDAPLPVKEVDDGKTEPHGADSAGDKD